MHATNGLKGVPPTFDSIQETIAAFRSGAFIVVLDSESRENEGDLIIAAQDMTPQKMSFMIHHTSGLICTPLSPALCKKLDLPPMVSPKDNEDPNKTAYTVSIDAEHENTTTGISARDRSLTCNLLADWKSTGASFRRPGHVFPLRARPGGVRERMGHTEAATEFCRLAGKAEVGVICEIVDEGEEVEGVAERSVNGNGMLRRDGCLAFARRWGLRCCTIEDLKAYVLEKERPSKGYEGTNGVH